MKHFFSYIYIYCAAISFITLANADTTPFSQYGMIQNVKNYSSNPFYNSNTYGATYPKIVYAAGPALQPSDCQDVVAALVENACSQRNNCKNTKLADIRPEIMVLLSKIPKYNYASSCAGYIDSIYDQYVKQSTNIILKTSTAFPVASVTTKQASISKLSPQQQAYNERAMELKDLQSETNTFQSNIYKANFPTIFNDLSFTQKNDIKQQGYAQYNDANVYVPLDVERDKSAYKSQTDALCENAELVSLCIKQYDVKEKNAEKAFFTAKDAYNADPTSAPLKTAFNSAKDKLIQAITAAIYSPCTCTANNRFKAQLLLLMNISSCEQSFLGDAKQIAKDYVTELL